MSEILTLLCLGDVVGEPGRSALKEKLAALKALHQPDFTIINAENAAGGLGPDAGTSLEIRSYGADVLTSGDHVWHKKEFREFLEQQADWAIRPANFPAGAPGRGWTIQQLKSGHKVGVFNLLGRIFLNPALDCPFSCADKLLAGELAECKLIICDMHAEATSEKIALARYLDGRVSLVFGTHTHVPTADERIFPNGTAFISDLGMCGSLESVIGMHIDTAVRRFTTGMPQSYKIGPAPASLNGIVVKLDLASGKAQSIQRVSL